MPHEYAWIDDCIANNMADLQKQRKKEQDVIETQNRALRTAINECPFHLRTPDTCRDCGNENCVIVWKEQNKIWVDDQSEPVSVVNTVNTKLAEMARNAGLKSPNMPEFRNHTQPASGSEPDLFTLINRESEEE